MTGAELVEVLRYALRAWRREAYFVLVDSAGEEAICTATFAGRVVAEADLFESAQAEIFGGMLRIRFGRNGLLQIGFPPTWAREDSAQVKWLRRRLQEARDVLSDPGTPATHKAKLRAKRDEAVYLEQLRAEASKWSILTEDVERARRRAPRVRMEGLAARFGPWRTAGALRAFRPKKLSKKEIPADDEGEE